jgi:hypothetical protein
MKHPMQHWFTAREGASLGWYQPNGVLEGVIEVHPEHPPIMHWTDGRNEELMPTADGKYAITAVDPFCPVYVSINREVEADELGLVVFAGVDDTSKSA